MSFSYKPLAHPQPGAAEATSSSFPPTSTPISSTPTPSPLLPPHHSYPARPAQPASPHAKVESSVGGASLAAQAHTFVDPSFRPGSSASASASASASSSALGVTVAAPATAAGADLGLGSTVRGVLAPSSSVAFVEALPSAAPPSAGVSKPVTPPRASSSRMNAQGDRGRDTRPGPPRSETKRKPTFTSVLSFHGAQASAVATATSSAEPEKELQRGSRRSKVLAINNLGRSGTPGGGAAGTANGAGPSGTSFVPPKAAAGPDAGPGPSRNPLHRPPRAPAPFDISSVRTSAPRHPPSRASPRLYNLPEAPSFHPTHEEFSDPLGYIASLPSSARDAGICKIVPPEGWVMPFSLQADLFRFKTRLQRLNQLEAASRAKVNFLEQLTMFHMQQGDAKVTIPVIDRRPLDVWRLRKEVTKMGGHENVTAIKGWERITELLGHAVGWANDIRLAHARIVVPFETFSARAKSASLSPLTPLSTAQSGKQKPPGWTAETPGSPTSSRPTRARMGGGGGNASAGASASASAPAPPRGRMGMVRPRRGQSPPPLLTSVSLPDPGTRESSTPLQNPPSTANAGPRVRLRIPGFDDRDDGTDSDLSDASPSPPPVVRLIAPEEKYQKGEVCEVCRKGNHADKTLLCDGCDRGFHIFCLDPPLAAVPTNEEWYCTPCLLSQGDDFGFEEGEEHSLASFQARDQAFSDAWWHKFRKASTSVPRSPVATRNGDANGASTPTRKGAAGSRSVSGDSAGGGGAEVNPFTRRFGKAVVSEDDVEREFWRLTESQYDTVEVEYGADVHSTTHGSAAPTTETHPMDPYSRDGWNLNNMPILPDSVLRYIKSDISGMTVPWIYIGMMFSAFCWHNEDHYTYSVNYMFWGETKTWYGIPGADAEKFEAAIRSEAPELFEQQPGLLYQLVTMMNPGRLQDEGVKVLACDQRPNEFVITFPKAYHCGFNHGINFNEAVNFALPDWLQQGREAVMKYREYAKPPVFSHNELLISITLYSDSIKTALWLQESLSQMKTEESAARERVRTRLAGITEKVEEEDCTEEQYQCCVCKAFSYLSQVTCKCTKLATCLEHAEQLCACPASNRTLRKRFSEAQLDEILAIVTNRAGIPGAWRQRYWSIMETRRPQLKTLRGLLTDGERIPYDLPEVDDLRALVDYANVWAEKVAGLATRKGATGRRRKRLTSEDEIRAPEHLHALYDQWRAVAFDCPEVQMLRRFIEDVRVFEQMAERVLAEPEDAASLEDVRTAVMLGEAMVVDVPLLDPLARAAKRLEWFEQVENEVDDRTLEYDQVVELLKEAKAYGIADSQASVRELKKREEQGRKWKEDVAKLENGEEVSIEAVEALVTGQELVPTDAATMRSLEQLLKTVQSWRTTASSLLAKNGSATAAQRLIKTVKAATGLAARVRIVEVDRLDTELGHHAEWLRHAAEVLNDSPARVGARLNDALRNIRVALSESDHAPNDEHMCFCRTESAGVMVMCDTCEGWYHSRCVGLSARAQAQTTHWRCDMCRPTSADARPSLCAVAELANTRRWNLVIQPAELPTLLSIIEVALSFSRRVVPLLEPAYDPHFTGAGEVIGRETLTLLQHYARKLFCVHLKFDAVNPSTNERIIFEEWLFRRIRIARTQLLAPPSPGPVPALAPAYEGLVDMGTAPVPTAAGGKRLARPRRPKLILAESKEREFACICHRPPLDEAIVVRCARCEQGFHASCVMAPLECCGAGHVVREKDANKDKDKDKERDGGVVVKEEGEKKAGGQVQQERKFWRCPCCTVKEGKRYAKNLEVRVQTRDQVGTDVYIDYRATVNTYVDAPLTVVLPPTTCVLLHCVQFVPAVKPEDVEPKGRTDKAVAIATAPAPGPALTQVKTEVNGPALPRPPSAPPASTQRAPDGQAGALRPLAPHPAPSAAAPKSALPQSTVPAPSTPGQSDIRRAHNGGDPATGSAAPRGDGHALPVTRTTDAASARRDRDEEHEYPHKRHRGEATQPVPAPGAKASPTPTGERGRDGHLSHRDVDMEAGDAARLGTVNGGGAGGNTSAVPGVAVAPSSSGDPRTAAPLAGSQSTSKTGLLKPADPTASWTAQAGRPPATTVGSSAGLPVPRPASGTSPDTDPLKSTPSATQKSAPQTATRLPVVSTPAISQASPRAWMAGQPPSTQVTSSYGSVRAPWSAAPARGSGLSTVPTLGARTDSYRPPTTDGYARRASGDTTHQSAFASYAASTPSAARVGSVGSPGSSSHFAPASGQSPVGRAAPPSSTAQYLPPTSSFAPSSKTNTTPTPSSSLTGNGAGRSPVAVHAASPGVAASPPTTATAGSASTTTAQTTAPATSPTARAGVRPSQWWRPGMDTARAATDLNGTPTQTTTPMPAPVGNGSNGMAPSGSNAGAGSNAKFNSWLAPAHGDGRGVGSGR